MRSWISALLLLSSCSWLHNAIAQIQDPHAAQPERPTVATHAGTVAPGWLEIEAGGEFDHYSQNAQGVGIPLNMKLGLGSDTQFSVFASAVQPVGSNSIEMGDIAVGLKWRLANDFPLLERFAVLPSIKFPTGSTDNSAGTGTTDANLLLISSHEFGPVSMDINLGYARRSGNGTATPRDATLWTISFGGPAVGIVGWVFETYGLPGTRGDAGKSPIVAILFGPTFTLKSFLILDLGVIVPIVGTQPHAIYSGGVWNIGRMW